jgi:signal transduction histidine kinase
MPGRTITIFCTTVAEGDWAALHGVSGAQVVQVTTSGLARDALAAVSRGPVLCVVGSDREAGNALRLGVDEVLRSGEVTPESLGAAISRAISRASVRELPEYRHALLDQDEEAAFAELGAAFGERLETPLTMASADCAAVAEAMNCLMEVDDQFVAWTALVAPSQQLRNLVARRLNAPPAPELRGVLRRLRASIGRAESLVRLLRDLTKSAHAEGDVSVSSLLADVADLMRPIIGPWAEINVSATPDCFVTASRTTVIVVVGVLLSSALDSIRAASRRTGQIDVRVFHEEDAVVLEVSDNGREIPTDLRSDLLAPQFGDASARRRGVAGLRDRVRRAGGDLLVDSSPKGSTVRVFLPSGRAADEVAPALGARPRRLLGDGVES